MTITTALSPARAQAFHTTQSVQSRPQGDRVKFSLPPINDPTAGGGSSAPASGVGNILPIAVPVAALSDIAIATPLPTAGPGTAGGTPFTGAAHNQGNLVSARMISRLYQGPN